LKTTLLLIALLGLLAVGVRAQKRTRKGKICGDPTVACKGVENFQPHDLVFDTGKNFVIFESEPFYGIVLKSVKLPDFGDCEKPSFKEVERKEIQALFEHNKVFMLNCIESGTNYYPGVADKTAFIAVYAGRTLAQANAFLKTVQALNKYPGIRVRKMSIAVNGT
jgi:hypothetical protein